MSLNANQTKRNYNRPTKSWLQDNDIDMHSRHNKGKLVVVEIFIITSKNNTKYQKIISKNVYIDKSTYHSTIKMTSTDTKYSTHIHFDKKSNTEDFKFCYHVRICKYKYILTKGYVTI